MPCNLLTKKQWHVGRTENKQRVQMDEKRARLVEEKMGAEANKEARMARLDLLRLRKQQQQKQQQPSSSSSGPNVL